MLRFIVGAVNLFTVVNAAKCRTQPGDPLFPTSQQLVQFNSSVDGKLIPVVPSGEFCKGLEGGCPDSEWMDSQFLDNIPGAMLEVSLTSENNDFYSSSLSRLTGSRYDYMPVVLTAYEFHQGRHIYRITLLNRHLFASGTPRSVVKGLSLSTPS